MENKDNEEKNPKEKSKNLFKGRFDKKVTVKGPDWFHDPSGEELEFIDEKE